jgi:hypothetical protein
MQITASIYAGVIPAIFRAMATARKTGIGRPHDVAEAQGAPAAAVRILKAAVSAGTLSDPAWAGNLVDMAAASQLFLQQLGGRSAFAALLDQGVITRAPLRSNVGSATTGAVGSVVEEGRATPVNKMTIALGKIAAQKADALIVLSREVLDNTSSAGQSFVNRQLRRGLGKALDVGIAASLTFGIAPLVATASPTDDIKSLLDDVNTGEGRLAWVAAKNVANRMALLEWPAGASAAVSPEGVSTFLNLPFAVSAGLADGTLILLDGDQVVGNIESLGVDISTQATLEMDTAPLNDIGVGSGDAPNPTNLVSLWQTDSVGLRLSAHFGVARGTNAAVAVMTGIAW